MNNDLEQFSEERLRKIIEFCDRIPEIPATVEFTGDEAKALALIALSAKQTKPVAYLIHEKDKPARLSFQSLKGFVSPEDIAEHELSQDDLYTYPQPTHTEQDGWIKCSERMPSVDDYYLGYSIAEVSDVYFDGWRFMDERVTHWMPLPAAPKPESE